MSGDSTIAQRTVCWLCGRDDADLKFDINEKPTGENDFGIDPQRYRRRIYQCRRCGVYFNVHDLLGEGLYGGAYNQAVYRRRLADKFHHIMGLPVEQSDNKQRVRRIVEFCRARGRRFEQTRVLDVGSGLCVFGAEMLKFGFRCCCIDPDPLATRHAVAVAGVEEAHTGTLDDYQPPRPFDLVTFNKVLEHVRDPIRQLARARELLNSHGFLYLELPDGDAALTTGSVSEREEFFVEHFTIFNRRSVEYLVGAAGLQCLESNAIRDPSGKCTRYAFCRM